MNPNIPDWKKLDDYLFAGGTVRKDCFLKLIGLVVAIVKNDPNMLIVNGPVAFVGDLHGQYYDFHKMIGLVSRLGDLHYVFMGDYVDRGQFSVEVLLLLFSLKLNFPKNMHLLRGNHESRHMTENFNFKEEVLFKYDEEVYERIMELFDCLSISALIEGKILAVHGGISPEIQDIKQIETMNRFQELPTKGILADLVWSDPVENEQGYQDQDFIYNKKRNCSYIFGQSAVNKFLDSNGLLCLVRAHEVQMTGYKLHQWNGQGEFPAVITIFSAPNYCDVYNNRAAILKFENNGIKIQQYNYSSHPFVLPDFMDAFTWSMPFVQEKVLEILHSVLAKSMQIGGIGTDEPNQEQEDKAMNLIQRASAGKFRAFNPDVIKYKLNFIGKVMRMQTSLRENHELLVKLKGMAPDKKIPRGLLMASVEEIIDALARFKMAKQMDEENEMLPPTYQKRLTKTK